MGEKRKNKDRLCTILMIVFFSILAILVILPIYTIFLASFKPGGDLLQYGLNLGIDWSRMSLDNYRYSSGNTSCKCICRIRICSL